MIRTWMLALGLIAFILAAPAAHAGSGCGACPVGGGKKTASTQEDTAGAGGQQGSQQGSDVRQE